MQKAYEYVETVTQNYKKLAPVINVSKYNELQYIVNCAENGKHK